MMAPLDPRDCFAAFGPCHRRQVASISSSTTYWSEDRTDASRRSTQSSRRTSLSIASADAELKASSNAPAQTQTRSSPPNLTSFPLQYASRSRCSRQTAGPSTARPRHVRTLSLQPSSDNPSLLRDAASLPLQSPELNGLRNLLGRTKKLWGSCCLRDLRIPGSPVAVSTDAGISRHLPSSTSSSTSGSNNNWSLQSLGPEDEEIVNKRLYLLLKRRVVNLASRQATFDLVARVDISDLLAPHGFHEDVADVWLAVAADAMRAAVSSKPHVLRHIPDPMHVLHTAAPDLYFRESLRKIHALYDAFVLIEPTAQHLEQQHPDASAYEVTHVSDVEGADIQHRLQQVALGLRAGEYKIARLLAQGEKFVFDARRELSAAHELVWCVPMAGEGGLKCWVAFLMHGLG